MKRAGFNPAFFVVKLEPCKVKPNKAVTVFFDRGMKGEQ